MFKCVKTHDSGVCDSAGSTNLERRGVSESDTTYVDPSKVGVHNENSDDIWSICTYSFTGDLFYAPHVQRYILLLIFAMNMEVKVFSTFDIWPFTEYSGYLVPAHIVNPPKKNFFFRRFVRPNDVGNNKNPSKGLIKMVLNHLSWLSLYHFFKSFNKEILWILVLAEA